MLPADDAGAEFRVLVFSKTTGFRHDSIDEGIAAIQALGAANDFQVDATEDASVFRAGILGHYDTVVFLSTTGDVLNAAQQTAFEDYIQGGGGYTGIHAAADTEYEWSWYGAPGGRLLPEPPARDARPRRSTSRTRITRPRAGIADPVAARGRVVQLPVPGEPEPGRRRHGDYSPRAKPNIHVLATVDEATYDEEDGIRRRQRRSPDLVVPALRRRPLVVHGHGPHRGVVRRGAVPAAPARRPAGLGGRRGRRRLR